MVEKTLSSSRQSMGQTFSPLGKCLFFFFCFGWIFKGGRRGKRSLILGWYLPFLQVKPCWIGLGFVHVLLHPTSFDTLLLLVSFSSLLSPSYSKRKTTVEEFRPPPYQGQHVAAFTLALLLFVVCCCCFCCCCFCCSFILLLFRFLLFYLLLMFFFSCCCISFCCCCGYFVAFPPDAVINTASPTQVAPGVVVGHPDSNEGLPFSVPTHHLLPNTRTIGALTDFSTASAVDTIGRGCGTIFLPRHRTSSSSVDGIPPAHTSFFPAHHYVGYVLEVLACHWYLENKFPDSNSRFTYNFRDVLHLSISGKKDLHPLHSNIHEHPLDGYSCLSGAHVFSL